ncbi:Na(+) H(+) antiporter subunit A [hydrothermal vent metagenome]|uniref:Na(+) H(+) antiporter subunit A n=1 Tax=hydrothermal vent metagenome TaxID=652676 RepID=A0A3B1C5S6_9ZZZZ
MINSLPPAVILIIGALLIPFLKGKSKSVYMLILPVIAFLNVHTAPEGIYWITGFLDYDLIFGRVDRLSRAFGYMFTIMAFVGTLYALHLKNEDGQHVAAFMYVGSALGAVFAGDLLTLFVFLEIMTLASTYLIWAKKTESSYSAGLRYLMVHLFGGLCLLAGIVIHVSQTGSIEFGNIGLNGTGSYLILIGFGVNCAFPVLHAWLPDAYPEATITGTVFLGAFTTKVAVYTLARSFPGTEILIWIGAAMTVLPIFYAAIENDLRKVLSYSIINQVGFMVVGIGIGTTLSINGAVAHTFNNVFFKALLFMSMGAVMLQTGGKSKATELGGLYRSMPLTTIFCIIGAASISGFPLFSGYVSKSMILGSATADGMGILWLVLLFASAGVLHHAGIKIPFHAFFGHDSGIRTKEPPLNMLVAMGIAAFLCVIVGIFPSALYSILPYPVDYEVYTGSHIMNMMLLLSFAVLAFCLLLLSGLHPVEWRVILLDTDWFYRKGAKAFYWLASRRMPWSTAVIVIPLLTVSAITLIFGIY